VLVLDAGNALFKHPEPGMDPTEKARAQLLLEQMDAMGTVAMAVGARDLTLGVDFLKQRAKKGKLQPLSANLVDAKGAPLFPASVVTTVGGVKLGLIGLSPPGELRGGVQGRPVLPAVTAEAKRLREKEKVDVVVVLAAIPYGEALQVGQQAEGVDFLAQSHDSRGVGMAQRNGFATLIPPGERGRQLARVELTLDGAGPFTDLTEATRAQESLKVVDANITRTKERLAATQDATAKQALQSALENFQARRAALLQTAGKGATGFPRTHQLSYISLGRDVGSDEALQKVVERIEAPGSAGH
jgi:2',3'-cyclic-nucleotide 2'-phosphodiesterase (5'-nucleotidase family)